MDDDSVIVLHVLLTLKHCLRCQNNNGLVSAWMTGNVDCAKALVSQKQPSRTNEDHGQTESHSLSISEQTSKAAVAIVSLCRPHAHDAYDTTRTKNELVVCHGVCFASSA